MLFFVSSTKIENMDDERKIQELTFKQRTAGQRAAAAEISYKKRA